MLGGMYEGATRARTMIRLPAMRKAVWLLAHDTAQVAFNACRGSGVLERSLLRRVGVGQDHWTELKAMVLAACAEPLQVRDIKNAVGGDEEQTAAAISVLASSGELVRLRAPSLTSNSFAFVSTDAYYGGPIAEMSADDSLAFLAADYLQAYGPITVDDFTWWSGLARGRCEEALFSHDPTQLDGGYLMWSPHVRAFEQSRPVANRVNLLPAWDAYPMGYVDRSRMGEPDAIAASFDRAGNSVPLVLVEGAVGGTWEHSITRDGYLRLKVTMFEAVGARLWEGIESEAGAIAALFQARGLKLDRIDERPGRASLAVEPIPPRPPVRQPAKRPQRKTDRAPAKKSAARKPVARKRAAAPRKRAAAKPALRKPVAKSTGRKPAGRSAVKKTPARRSLPAAAKKRAGAKRVPKKLR